MKRSLRPRATASLAIAPATVTDLTAAVVTGLEPWQFRKLVKDERVPHARLGQRMIAKVEDVVAAIERIAKRQSGAPPEDGDDEAEASEGPTADRILARLDRVWTGGRR